MSAKMKTFCYLLWKESCCTGMWKQWTPHTQDTLQKLYIFLMSTPRLYNPFVCVYLSISVYLQNRYFLLFTYGVSVKVWVIFTVNVNSKNLLIVNEWVTRELNIVN